MRLEEQEYPGVSDKVSVEVKKLVCCLPPQLERYPVTYPTRVIINALLVCVVKLSITSDQALERCMQKSGAHIPSFGQEVSNQGGAESVT